VLEPVVDVKMKEKLATVLVAVFHKDGLVQNFLTDILVTEINKLGTLQTILMLVFLFIFLVVVCILIHSEL